MPRMWEGHDLDDVFETRVAPERIAQGKTPTIEDETVLRRIARRIWDSPPAVPAVESEAS